MNYKIVCDYCNEDTFFTDIIYKPEYCSHCGESTEACQIIKTSDSENKIHFSKVESLSLICQNTGIELILKNNDKITICRELFDDKIPGKNYISGSNSGGHCIFELVNNQFVVTDLHSLNGTYLGIEKIDCKTNPKQTVKDNDLIFLGREPFIIKLVFSVSINENSFIQENDDIVKYKCKKCDFISIDNSKICSGCNSYMNSQDWELCDND